MRCKLVLSRLFHGTFLIGCAMILGSCAATQDKPDVLSENARLFVPDSAQILKTNFARYPIEFAPAHPKHISFDERLFQLNIYASEFAPSKVIYVEIAPKDTILHRLDNITVTVDKVKKKLRKGSGVWYFLYANKPGSKKKFNDISVEVKGNPSAHFEYKLELKKIDFPVAKSRLNVGAFSNAGKKITPDIEKFIEWSREKKKTGFRTGKADYLSWNLAHPRDIHKVTSPFLIRREYERFKVRNGKTIKLKPTKSTHRGLDLKGLTGAPIYAIADGKVTLADFLYAEGGIVMIDHGAGVLSGYMHQSELMVKAGDIVQAGQQIGKTGATGMVTGPHLHLFLYVEGVLCDPLSLLVLPVKVAPQYADLSALSTVPRKPGD